MKIAITTPTGHVGSTVTGFLLDKRGDIKVKLLGRRPNLLRKFVERGAETAIGPQDDSAYLVKATEDVDALFWVTPPGYGSDDLRAFQNRIGAAAAAAIRTNRIAKVVNLSSIGADCDSGVGPIGGLHDVEERLNEAATEIVHLRPGFFFENLLWQVESIRSQGSFSLPLSGKVQYPMVATRDIGRVAADRLVSSDWSGQLVQELHGPADLSFEELAKILSQALEKGIVFVQSDREETRQLLRSSGMSENAIDLMIEMYSAVESGRIRSLAPACEVVTTPTTFAEFAREVLLPLVSEAVHH